MKSVQLKFNAGEMSGDMEGQLDFKKYLSGARELLNMIPKAQGGIYRRMGTEFIGYKKDQSGFSITITHQPTLDTVYQIELGQYYGRIWKDGSLVKLTSPTGADEYTFTTPWTREDVKTIFYSGTIDVLRFYHRTGTKKLSRYSVGVTEDWRLEDYEYADGPYDPDEDTGIVLTLSSPTYILELESQAAFGVLTPGNYLEYRQKNQWYLGRILGTATTPPAPADPTASKVYIEPVSTIVRNIATEARMYYSTVDFEGNSVQEVRSTVKVFNYALKGAYFRFEDTAASSTPKWARITNYVGLKDYPEKTYVNPSYTNLTIAHTYKVTAYTSGSITTDSTSGYLVNDLGETFTLGAGYAVTSPLMTIADMSTLKQLDVVAVDAPVTPTSVTATVTVKEYKNEATIKSTDDIFDSDTSPGRFLRLKLGDKYVSTKILSYGGPRIVTVKLLSEAPYQSNSNELVDNGNTNSFRMGSFYYQNFPICGVVHERRHVVAGAPSYPEAVHFSELGKEDVFTPSEEDGGVESTTAFLGEATADSLSTVRWLATAVNLVIGSESGEYLVRTLSNGQPITSENAKITADSAVGSILRPIKVDNALLFVQRSGLALNQLQFSYETESLDVTKGNTEANHIFRAGGKVVSMAFQQYPDPIIWFCMGNGDIATLTYDKKEQVLAWARSRLGGNGLVHWVSVATSPDGTKDVPYFSVQRGSKYTYERLADWFSPQHDEDKEGMVYLDCHTKYGPGVTVLDGLSRFEGEEVGVVVDGTELPPRVVSGESITLEEPTVGYAYVGYRNKCRFRPVPPVVATKDTGTSVGSRITISEVTPLVKDTLSMKIGINESNSLTVSAFSTTSDAMSKSPPLKSGFIKVPTLWPATYNPDYVIFTDTAYPLNILALVQEVVVQ